LIEIIEKAGEPAIRELKKRSGYGWSPLYNVLKSLRNKGLIDLIPKKGRERK